MDRAIEPRCPIEDGVQSPTMDAWKVCLADANAASSKASDALSCTSALSLPVCCSRFFTLSANRSYSASSIADCSAATNVSDSYRRTAAWQRAGTHR